MGSIINDMEEFSRMAASFRLQGFVSYAQDWERVIDRLFNEYPELESEFLDAQERGVEKARK